MADKMPPLPGAGKSSGSTMPPLPGGGNVGGRNTAFSSDLITRQLRNAIGAGDVKTVKQLARGLNVSDRNVKALAAFTSKFTPKTGFASILPDLGTVVNPANLAKGIGQFAFGVGQEAVGFPTWKRALEGKKLSGLDIAGGIPLVGMAVGSTRGFFDKSKRAEELAPGTNLIGQSFRRSYERVIHPTQLIKQYSERPVLTGIEDLGNLAMVLGPTGKLVGAGASAASAGEAAAIAAGDTARAAQLASRAAMLSKVAGRLGQVENVANITVNAPFLPYSAAAKLANRGIAAGLEKFGGQALAQSGVLEANYPRIRSTLVKLRMTPESRMIKRGLTTAETTTIPLLQKEQVAVYPEAAKILKTENEQRAYNLTVEGRVDALARAKAVMSPEQFETFVETNVGERFVPAVDMAIEAYTGNNPKLASQFEEVKTLMQPSKAATEQQAMQYLNRAEQLGFKPQEAPIERALKAPRKEVARLQKVAEEARKLAEESQSSYMEGRARLAERKLLSGQERLAQQEIAMQNDPVYAPARLRPMMQINQALQRELAAMETQYRQQGWTAAADQVAAQADGILTTLRELEAAGVDVQHVIHARPMMEPIRRETGSKTAGQRIDTTMFPRDKKRQNVQQFRSGRGEYDLTFRSQALETTRRIEQHVRRQVAGEISNMPFMRRANDTIFKVKDATTGEMRNPMLREIPEGWEAWSPRTLFGNVEAKGPLADNVIIGPKDIIDSYKQYFKKAGGFEQFIRVTYDPAIQAFKTMVLPLWPAWNVVNVLGNAFLATFVAGETPLSLARGFAEVLRRRKEMGTWDVVDNPRLYQAGQTVELRDFINPYKKASKLQIAIDKAGSLGFKANQVVDDMFRSSVYLAKKAKGYSDEQALRLALDSMGDFTNLSQFERQVVRRIVPFYTWLRHMTKVAVKLPIEHPWRTAWMLSLAQDFSERDPWENILPTYMRGGIDIGGGTYLNAYNISPLTTPGEAVRAILEGRVPPVVTPPITMLDARRTGLDPLTGIPYSRQPGTGRISETGVEIPTAPPLSQQLLNLSPQARLIQELTGRKDIARYASGQPVMVRNEQGKLVPLKTATQPNVKRIAAALLGTRTTTRKQMKDMVDAIIARNVALYKAANPEKQLSSGGTKNQMPPLP